MKTTILVSSLISVAMLIMGVVVLKGYGDNFVSNYRSLTDEQKARVNVRRMRIITAITLAFVAVVVPCAALARTDAQHLAIVIVTAVVVLALLLALRFWAGVPLARKILKK